MSSKSLLYNSNMYLFTCRKPTNEYKVDACYHSYDPIYSVAISKILQETKMVPIHDKWYQYCILYNKCKWSSLFQNWFESKCIRIAPRASLNSIIFQSNKFILITWLAPKGALFAYPGYEKSVSVCGGLAIDANKIIDEKLQFVFESETIWYIDSGESFEIIADANKSIIHKVHCIMKHVKFVSILYLLSNIIYKKSSLLLTKYTDKNSKMFSRFTNSITRSTKKIKTYKIWYPILLCCYCSNIYLA